MQIQEIVVKRSDLGVTQPQNTTTEPLGEGQIRLEVEQIGLSANNISYASAGDALGYWAHFSKDSEWGNVPVWGYSRVIESKVPEISTGEQIFGFLPMASHATFTPVEISETVFSDRSLQRRELHPWYVRCYRCDKDPAFSRDLLDIQPTLWALFMTGLMMADELIGNVDSVYISSASSKTAISLAWALKNSHSPIEIIGLTSESNAAFVKQLDLYSSVMTYDNLHATDAGTKAAYVDIAGNAGITSAAHVMLGEKLIDSVLIGATHRAPSAEPLPMPGPTPRFFFIPNVAEERAANDGFEIYHRHFSDAWLPFAHWAAGWINIERGRGPAAIESGYLANLAGGIPPDRALIFSWK